MHGRTSFPWTDTTAQLRRVLAETPLELDAKGRAFIGGGWRVLPPQVVPIRGRDPETYLHDFPDALGVLIVVLLQAGAASLGLWQDDELVRHKVIKKYVVRGKGRAQSTHLKTKGKSRQGSRLRLQGARSLLREVNVRLACWCAEDGPIDTILYSCPVRLWADLFAATPPPPFGGEEAVKIGLGVRVPGFDELLRVRRALLRGAIESGIAEAS